MLAPWNSCVSANAIELVKIIYIARIFMLKHIVHLRVAARQAKSRKCARTSRPNYPSTCYMVESRFSNSSASRCTSAELQLDLTLVTRRESRSFPASSRARFHKFASKNKSNRSSEEVTRSMYLMISDTGCLPIMAAMANGLKPMGGLAFESPNARSCGHCWLSARALTLMCQSRFSGTLNFLASLSTSPRSL